MSSAPAPADPGKDSPGTALEPRSRSKARTVLWLAVKLAILAVVLFYLVRALVDRFRAIDWANLQPDIWCLLGAVGLITLMQVVYGAAYRLLLAAFCPPPRWATVLAVAWVSQLGKYVPGKLLSVAGGMWLLRKQNVPLPVGMAINFMLMGLYVVLGMVIGAPMVLLERMSFLGPLTWLWSLAVLAAAVVVLHPRVFVGLINFGLRRIGRQGLTTRPRLRDYAGPLALVLLQWLLFGTSFWLVVHSISDVPLAEMPFLISASALAVTAGFVAVFAPAGLGVREGLLLLLVGPVLGDATTALAIVTMRLFQVIVECGMAGIGAIILRFTPAPPATPILVDDVAGPAR